jgi:hypothetical protein
MPSPRLPADTGVVRTSRGAAFLVPPTDEKATPEAPPGPTPPSRRERLPATRLRPSRRGRIGRTIYFPADLIRVVDDQWREVAAEIPGGVGKTAFYIACIIAGLEDRTRIQTLLRADPHGASLAREYLAKQTSPGVRRPA